jgi:hypothetical protein
MTRSGSLTVKRDTAVTRLLRIKEVRVITGRTGDLHWQLRSGPGLLHANHIRILASIQRKTLVGRRSDAVGVERDDRTAVSGSHLLRRPMALLVVRQRSTFQ